VQRLSLIEKLHGTDSAAAVALVIGLAVQLELTQARRQSQPAEAVPDVFVTINTATIERRVIYRSLLASCLHLDRHCK